jgi:hypothetical protein
MLFQNADEGIEMMSNFDSKVFKEVLPNSTFLPRCYAGNAGGHFSFKDLFIGTDYEQDKKELFCHFTSVQSLVSILKGGYLRMSEFNHLIDINEIQYGSKIFKDFIEASKLENRVSDLKETCFSLSACISSEPVKTNSFLWESYGNKGNGVIIEFEILYKDVESMLLGKIQYGKDDLKPLEEIKQKALIFKELNDFIPSDFPTEIIELLAFHKELRYKSEEEIRLFMKVNKPKYEEHSHIAIYKDVTNNNLVRWFFRLFLEGRKDVFKKEDISDDDNLIEDYFSYYPTIRIKNIILGSSLTIEQKIDIVYLIDQIRSKHNYTFNINHLNNDNEILNWN